MLPLRNFAAGLLSACLMRSGVNFNQGLVCVKQKQGFLLFQGDGTLPIPLQDFFTVLPIFCFPWICIFYVFLVLLIL
jgi:hypothetical protein